MIAQIFSLTETVLLLLVCGIFVWFVVRREDDWW
jgi:hypothetical protein